MSKIRVHSKRPGFRRAGMEFGAEPRELDTANLKAGQLKQLEDEPMLVVEHVGEDTSKGGKGGGAAGKPAGETGKSAGAGGESK